MSALFIALKLASSGVPVFPCGDDKRPLTPHGFKDATRDKGQIRQWWRKHPSAAVGYPTGQESGLFVLDIDLPQGKRSLRQLEERIGSVRATRCVRTPSGGLHYIFRVAKDKRTRTTASTLGRGIDTRGDGGYAIAAGSRIRAGRYRVIRDREPAPIPPALLLELTGDRAEPAEKPEASASIKKGERNARMFDIARKLHGSGLTPDAVIASLRQLNKSLCDPPLPSQELRGLAKSAANYADKAELVAALPDFNLDPVGDEWLKTKPPPREYDWGMRIPSNTVTLLIAEGGAGKSHLALRLSMAIAAGEALWSAPTRKGRVLYLALEDPPEELHDRIHSAYQRRLATLKKSKIKDRVDDFEASIRANYIVKSLLGEQVHLIAMERGSAVQTAAVDQLIAKLRGKNITTVVLDPMSRLHGGDENANAWGTALINAAERIAREVGCTVIILHHTGKKASTAGREDAYAARGASGIADAARVVLRLIEMDPAEARRKFANFDAEQLERGVLRLIHAKCNYGPKQRDLYLKRLPTGELDQFDPVFTNSDGAGYEQFLPLMRRWAEQHGESFTKTEIKNGHVEIFNGQVSRTNALRFFDKAVGDTQLVPSGKTKGHPAYTFAPENGNE